jgi:hydroxyacylglutathione hydrolase
MEVPGHTLGHLAFYVETLEGKHLFCGDTLFASGCGRVFEGTYEQMFHSLMKLKKLPEDTWVHCAHEYTLSNIKFALAVEPHNQDLLDWKVRAQALRNAGKPTLPTTIAHEKRVNPFLRSDMSPVIAAVNGHQSLISHEPWHVFAALRAWKDGFK